MISALTLQGKLVAGAVALTLAVTAIGFGVHKLRTDAFKAGVASEQAASRKALDKANEANAKKTGEREGQIAVWADRYSKLSARRQEREAVIVTQIEDKLVTEQNCQITPELLAIRNRLRTQ